MNKKGRIIGPAAILLSGSIGYYSDLQSHHSALSYFVFFLFMSALGFIGWRLGKNYDKIFYFAGKDELTGINNRRFVKNRFSKLAQKTMRHKKKLTLCLFDVDHFKTINDNFGHQVGDHVLQCISNSLKRSAAQDDYVVRWGGDEFIMITSTKSSAKIAQIIQEIQNDLLLSKLGIDLSISYGTAVFPDHHFKLNKLIHIADQDMYSQKRQKIKKIVN